MLPPSIKLEIEQIAEYDKKHGTDFYSDLIKKEMKSRRRVYEDKYVVAFTPTLVELNMRFGYLQNARHLIFLD